MTTLFLPPYFFVPNPPSSIDELPQILNVFIGQMSFGGPRASTWEDKVVFEFDERDKMLVKPGITGYSQAYYRNSISPRESVPRERHQ